MATLRHRLPWVVGLVLLYLGGYWTATRITLLRGPAALVHTTLPFDRLLPYLPASWPLYWIAYPFVIVGGAFALVRLPEQRFRRAAVAVAGMTVAGVLVQILFPAQAPWPTDPAPTQRLFHESRLILPYATLPSMHVAYTTVVTGLLTSVVPGRLTKVLGLLLVVVVAVATLTLREHVILDAVSGIALGALALLWWGGALPRWRRRREA